MFQYSLKHYLILGLTLGALSISLGCNQSYESPKSEEEIALGTFYVNNSGIIDMSIEGKSWETEAAIGIESTSGSSRLLSLIGTDLQGDQIVGDEPETISIWISDFEGVGNYPLNVSGGFYNTVSILKGIGTSNNNSELLASQKGNIEIFTYENNEVTGEIEVEFLRSSDNLIVNGSGTFQIALNQ